MRSVAEFAYAQARIEARHGERLQDVEWKMLESAQSLSRYLERARSTSLKRFLTQISPDLSAHAIERVLRSEAVLYVGEIATWARRRFAAELDRRRRDARTAGLGRVGFGAPDRPRPGPAGRGRRRSGRIGTPLASPLAGALAAGRRLRRRSRAPRRPDASRARLGRRTAGDDGGTIIPPRPHSPADAFFPQSWGVSGRARLPCRARPDRHRAAAGRSGAPQPVRRRRGKDRGMTFRPLPAHWFELVTTKAHVASALGALALTGAVELESRADLGRAALLPDLDELLKAYRGVARSYEGHWPAPRAVARSGDPRALLEADWRRVSDWRNEADPAIARVESLARERVDLDALLDALTRAGDEFPDPARLAGAGPRMGATLARLPPQTSLGPAARGALTLRWEAPTAAYVLAVGPPAFIREIAT